MMKLIAILMLATMVNVVAKSEVKQTPSSQHEIVSKTPAFRVSVIADEGVDQVSLSWSDNGKDYRVEVSTDLRHWSSVKQSKDKDSFIINGSLKKLVIVKINLPKFTPTAFFRLVPVSN